MENKKLSFTNIDEYIRCFPEDVQTVLKELRSAILKAAPDAEEKISYQMPAFALGGNLVYFAAYKNHIGFYPTSSGIKAFLSELDSYKTSKGAIQFPIGQPLPLKLIARIVKFRVEQNKKAMIAKKKKAAPKKKSRAKKALKRKNASK
ncbi:iron chaperone [Leptospira kmetyi]|uniref:YdhG-like domain-containing protein n=1 Tax=Leptospira kmetyi TaxID=408139 RepID=A0ABX4NHZ5_9LEPT|nr:DUF1801 domain-containing protein [Leptospira kmetyi]PJZ31827.1 hypothetical protein CH378_01035 [Leptospira kmetyi]TGL68175.1 DUF1801 domain-containing protein [Leptospira kmetyi]